MKLDYNTKAVFTVGSLFAGIGGFCRAFENVGFQVLWANENDPFAIQTYKHNLANVKLYSQSIVDLSVVGDRLEPVDVLTAGFPCQPFSVAGNKRGFNDPRGTLFFEIIRLLKEFGKDRPKIVVMENVKNLLYHNKGKTFNRMIDEVQAAGYWFDSDNTAILNTKDHTDIPQNRERLFMVAVSWDVFSTNDFVFPEPVSALKSFREFLDLESPGEPDSYFDKNSKYGNLFAESIASGDPESAYLLRRWYVRESKKDCIFTLTANMGEGGHNVPVIEDRWGIRKLSPLECLRLQGFKADEFSFPPGLSKTQGYRQVGNTITVPLVQLLATECLVKLQSLKGAR